MAGVVCLAGAIAPIGSTYAATPKKQVVTVWSWFIEGTMEKAIQAFEKKHPNVVVHYQYYNYSPQYLTALKAAAASNSLPDIIGLQPGSLTQQYRPYLSPINSLAAKTWGKNWEQLIFPVDLKQMRMGNPPNDNNYYIIPHESQVICIWYNVQIFKQLGLQVPKTLDQLKQVAKVLSSHGYIPMYQGAADGWQNENVFLMIADQIAPGLIDKAQYGEASWTSPKLVQAMKVWQSLFTDGVFQTGALGAHAYPTGAQLFADGRVGMMALGSWWLQESRYAPPIPPLVQNMKGFDFFYFPAIQSGGKASPPIGGIDIGYGLTKNGARNPAAWEFLSSLVNGEGEQAALDDLNDLPSFQGFKPKIHLTSNVVRMYSRFMSDLPKAYNQRIAYPAIADALDNALAAVAAGKESPESALQAVEATTKKTLGH
ncbi:MAG: extracellular solute-binding protein [Alicyclobacillus sp.]|nr:extracellular solute-binding protein [Alicyclobacillus sp.]